MINENETNTYENIEKAITKRLVMRCYKQQKQINLNEINTLFKVLENKYQRKPTAEYLKFLMRFYENKTSNNAQVILNRYLKNLNIKFGDLDTTEVYKQYRKLIKFKLNDYNLKQDEEDLNFFGDCAINSHNITIGRNVIHRLQTA